jgi:outer membrane protein assembly factor BamD
MCHFNEMPKPDRDNAHAKAAEEEFQTFLTKYPKDPLAPEAQQHLREVQEVIAEGQFRIGYYYYVKQDRRAAAGRLIPLTRRYPLYSKSDTALWMLADVFEKSERKDIAGNYYAQIVKNYPLSKYVAGSKEKLKEFGMPIPQPDQKAMAWMTAEQNTPRPKETVVHKGLGIFHSGPDTHTAAKNGVPNMDPESDQPGTDTLTGSKGSTMGSGGAPGSNAVIETVKPGEPQPAHPTNTSGASEDTTTAPANEAGSTDPAATSSTDGVANGATAAPASDGTGGAPAADGASTEPAKADTADSSTASTTEPSTTPASQKESSSKKKGLKRFIPW